MAAFITPYYLLYGPVAPAWQNYAINEEIDAYDYGYITLEYEVDIIHPFIQMIVEVEIAENPSFLIAGYMDIRNSTGDIIEHIIFSPPTGIFTTGWYCAQGHYNITIHTTGNPYTVNHLEGHILVLKRGWPAIGWWECPLVPP